MHDVTLVYTEYNHRLEVWVLGKRAANTTADRQQYTNTSKVCDDTMSMTSIIFPGTKFSDLLTIPQITQYINVNGLSVCDSFCKKITRLTVFNELFNIDYQTSKIGKNVEESINPFYPGDSFRGNVNITSSSLTWLSVAQFRHNIFVTIHLEVVRNCFGNTLNQKTSVYFVNMGCRRVHKFTLSKIVIFGRFFPYFVSTL